MTLSCLGYSLRELLAEQGYEVTPDELVESIDDSITLCLYTREDDDERND